MGVNAISEAGQQANEELNFKGKMEKINRELEELKDTDTSNDKVKNIDKYLNSAFMDELLKKENEEAFNRLKDTVNRLMNNPETARAGGEGLTRLDKFLGDIDNQGRMKGDYEEFKEKIKVPSKLNTMKSWEIRRLNLYLGSKEHKEDALEVYKEMKKIEGDFDGKKMKSEDEEFFGNVWKTLKNSYSTDPDFIDQDYPGVKVLENAPTADNLKRVVKDSEKWSGETGTIKDVQSTVSEGNSIVDDNYNSIIDKNYVIDMVKEANNKRITNNKNAVNAINIGVDDSKFMLEGDNLKYNSEDFTSDMMMNYFGDSIKVAAGKSGSFINDAERDNTVNKYKDTIFQKLKDTLKDKLKDNGQEEIPENGKEAGNEWTMSEDDFDAMQKSLGEGMFIEKDAAGKVSYNLEKTKAYLDSIKDTEWNQLKSKYSTPEGRAWISAVQILLNEEEGDKIKVDGRFGSETRNRIKDYQNEYNKNVPDGGVKLNPDGLPGKNTMKALLGEDPEAEVPTSRKESVAKETEMPASSKVQEKEKLPLEYAISELGLKLATLSTEERHKNGLPEGDVGVYTRESKKGFYYSERGNIVYVPNITSNDNVNFCKQTLNVDDYKKTKRETWVKSYPPVTDAGKKYLQRLLDIHSFKYYSDSPTIIKNNDKYQFKSSDYTLNLSEKFFTEGFVFGGEDLINNLKALQKMNYEVKEKSDRTGNFLVGDRWGGGGYGLFFKGKANGKYSKEDPLSTYSIDILGLRDKNKLNNLCNQMNSMRNNK